MHVKLQIVLLFHIHAIKIADPKTKKSLLIVVLGNGNDYSKCKIFIIYSNTKIILFHIFPFLIKDIHFF